MFWNTKKDVTAESAAQQAMESIGSRTMSFPRDIHVLQNGDYWEVRIRCTHERAVPNIHAFLIKVKVRGGEMSFPSEMPFSSQFQRGQEQHWGWYVPGELFEVGNSNNPEAYKLIPRGSTHG